MTSDSSILNKTIVTVRTVYTYDTEIICFDTKQQCVVYCYENTADMWLCMITESCTDFYRADSKESAVSACIAWLRENNYRYDDRLFCMQ